VKADVARPLPTARRSRPAIGRRTAPAGRAQEGIRRPVRRSGRAWRHRPLRRPPRAHRSGRQPPQSASPVPPI